jgi:hypothetical protein
MVIDLQAEVAQKPRNAEGAAQYYQSRVLQVPVGVVIFKRSALSSSTVRLTQLTAAASHSAAIVMCHMHTFQAQQHPKAQRHTQPLETTDKCN